MEVRWEVGYVRNLLFLENGFGMSLVCIQSIVRLLMRFHRCCQEFERYLRRNMSAADLLVTAVDPNLGFTGGSYRAANWQQWMTVQARPYVYEYGRYVTPRQLRERFGTSSLVELHAQYPGRFRAKQGQIAGLNDLLLQCQWGNEGCACSG